MSPFSRNKPNESIIFVTGMFMDLEASIILLCPIFFPLIQALGIDPMFFGIITVISLAIGLVTPPVGATR